MKCEKQSEKCQAHRYTTSADAIMPMTDHLLTFIPRPVWMAPCHRDSFAFCFRALYDDGDSWRPRLQNAEVLICLKDSLTFARCSFFPSLSTYFGCEHLCQRNILIISLSFFFFPAPLLPPLHLFLFSLSLSPSLSSVFPSDILQGPGVFRDQTGIFPLVDAFVQNVQRPA